MKQLKVFFFGDSVSFGQGVSPHLTWVTKISKNLAEEFSHKKIVFSNLGVNGNTTRLGLERMYYDVLSHRPNVVVIQFGLNDCNYWKTDMGFPRVSQDSFASNIREMIGRIRIFGCDQVVLNTNHPTTRSTETMDHTSLTYQESNEEYNSVIRKLAAEFSGKDFSFCDIEKLVWANVEKDQRPLSEFVLDDGLHLSETGHQFYFENLYPVVKESLTRCLDSE